MMENRKILVPVDIDDANSKKILNYAAGLIDKAEGELIVMHVVPFNPPYDGFASEDAIERSLSRAKLNAEDKLIKCLESEQIKKEKVLVYVFVGDPAEKILKVAEEEKAGLIVMGNKCSGVGCRIFGSVAFKVVQESLIPVTIIPTN